MNGADPERDYRDGMKKPEEDKISKDDDQPHKKHRIDEEALAIATQRKQIALAHIAAVTAQHNSHPDQALQLSDRDIADSTLDLNQFYTA